jgi:chemotaxis protein MotA
MDIATLVGATAGVGIVVVSILMAGESPVTFMNAPSIIIVFGGTTAAVLVSFPLGKLLSMTNVVKNAFFEKAQAPMVIIRELVRYAEVARRDGILALEGFTDEMEDEFLITGIQMAVDGTDPELIEEILSSELDAVSERHRAGKRIFDAFGKYAPAFGMIGTLIGLIIMLQHMEDPTKIGRPMALALITTLYGVLAANLIFLPIAEKLALRSREEQLIKDIIIRGVMSIQSGDNPRMVEQKLLTFLPPRLREEQAPAPGV